MAVSTGSATQLVESLIKRYPHIPQEAIIKEDLLRTGVCFTDAALEIAAAHQSKSYFIFSFDLTPFEQMQGKEYRKAPEELCLEGGPMGFRRTIVSVRLNPRSPYRVVEHEG